MPTVEIRTDVCAECGQVVKPDPPFPPPPERWFLQYFTSMWHDRLFDTEEERKSFIVLCEKSHEPYRLCHIPGAKADE